MSVAQKQYWDVKDAVITFDVTDRENGTYVYLLTINCFVI